MIKSSAFVCFWGFVFCTILLSCKKETFITDPAAGISLSADTIRFDTVFTSVGSTTQSFKIINDNNQKILLSRVKLMGGNASPFRININGIPANESSNIEIAANDSIYVFVSVNINPNSANLPFIATDSILLNCNGNNRYVQLEAYGKNAHFLKNTTISKDTIWNNSLPFVILGKLEIATNATLTINEGCKIYLHADAPFLIDGIIKINGTKNNEVVFAGDRIDEYYRDLPASWPGIYFNTASSGNEIRFAVIKNAYRAIVLQGSSSNTGPKLLLQQTIIDNAFESGLLAINSSVTADNCLISNCGNNLSLLGGGNYDFTHCTVVSYSNIFMLHKTPVLQVNNYTFKDNNIITTPLNAVFKNCIFWGDGGTVEDEIVVEKEGNTAFSVMADYCLYKAINDPSNITISSSIKNKDPLFDNIDIGKKVYDFRITKDPSAPGIDAGTATLFTKDLDDKPRVAGTAADVGCYEKPD